ncbi:disease resistance protein RUN1-like [Juglans regia]|uniref:Disease resistance protein RUN1-like n=1 Tax=Juglans regia TaxID=51240 RepID=A0A6P9EVS5_JUGRE|nr:disease resistance protein RUN1-like [Juglans regia]
MARVGKTTLAEVIYDRISYQFEASNFIACIREETTNCGLVTLQKQILSKILMERAINIWDNCEGMNTIRNRLCYKKVFLVLDDVDKEEHLTALTRSHDWFGLVSRIILMSRDNHLLKRHGLNDIYKVNELNNDEALQLFSLVAFKKPYLEENYVDLSKGFVKYAQGLPLSLKVLGSSLFGRVTNASKGAWDLLKGNPNKGFLDILQSFGSLKCFDLSGSQNLLETPNFTEVSSLETLDLEDVSDCLALGGIQDMNGEGYLEQLYKGGIAIKFPKFFVVPEFGSNYTCSMQEMFMINDDSVAAFYFDFDDRVYYIRSLNHEESNL